MEGWILLVASERYGDGRAIDGDGGVVEVNYSFLQ